MTRHCSTLASAKGSVKKIRFAPGKGNTKILILYSNRLDVRDALEVGVMLILIIVMIAVC